MMGAFKCTATLRRRPDFDLGAFSRHWSTVHRELALRLVPPGIMRAYVQNHRLEPPLGSLAAPGDGAPEVWVDSPQEVLRLATSPQYLEGARPDEPNFMSGDACMVVGCETVVVRQIDRRQAAAASKAMIFAPRGAGVPLEALCSALERAAPTRLSYERAVPAPAALGEPGYDWILSAWWPDAAQLDAAWAATERGLGEIRKLRGMLIRELIVLLPGNLAT
jgi:EthD domain